MRVDYVIRMGSKQAADSLRTHAEQRVGFALRRFRDRIRDVTVRCEDLNGPKGGPDTRCVLMLQLVGGGRLVTQATAGWPPESVTRATARLKDALRRELARARDSRRGRRARAAVPGTA